MKIEAIHIHEYQKSFNLQFSSSHLTRTKPDSLIVKFDFDTGLTGLGETTPRPYVTGETLETVVQTLRMWASAVLFSTEVNTIGDVTRLLSKLKEMCIQRDVHNYLNALTVVDLALIDALGKQLIMSAGQLLGPKIREHIPYAVSVPFLTLEEIEALYPVFAPFKIGFIKVLLGNDDTYNLEKVKLIRSLLGDEVVLQAEINGYWTFDQAVTTLKRIEPYHISAIEQPFSAKDENMVQLAQLKKQTGLAIILDESVCTLSDARRFLEADAVDMINIKIAKCGGLLLSKQIAELAAAYDKICHLGAHVGETAILTNAGLHFAVTTQNIRYFEGFSFMLFQNDSLAPEQARVSAENIRCSDGLGVTEEAYEQLLADSTWVDSIVSKK